MKKRDDGTFRNVFFSTKGGQLLKQLIEGGLNLKKENYYIDYAYGLVPTVIKRDKYNRAIKYKPPTQTEANREYKYLYERIVKEKPDIIVPTGGIGCKALLNKTAITQLRGVPEKITVSHETETGDKLEHETWVLPMFSMEYMLVNPSVQNLVEADFVTLKKFIDQGEDAFQASPVDYEFVDNIERVEEIFTKEVKKAPIVAWDLETNTLQPEYKGAKPLVISLSWEEGTGCTIPLEHKDFSWGKDNLDKIYEYIKEFVADPNTIKVGHNLQYDVRFLRLTKGFTEFKSNRDTMIMYYVLINQDVEASLALSDMAYELTDMGGYDKALDEYKKEFIQNHLEQDKARIKKMREDHKEKVKREKAEAKERGEKYVTQKVTFPKASKPVNEIDGSDFNYEWFDLIEMLHPYASGDVDACLRIYNKLDELGKKEGNEKRRKLYTEHYPELTNSLAYIEANGVAMDVEYNDNLSEAYEKEMEVLLEKLRELPEVKQLEEEHRKLYERGLQEWALPKAERDEEVAKLRDKYKKKLEFNPNATDDLRKILYKIPNLRLPYNKEYIVDSAMDNGIPEDEIEWYHYKANKVALEYIKEHHKEMEHVADALLHYSLVKTRSQSFTYKLRDMVDDNNLLHGRLLPTGTTTSRLASRNPKCVGVYKLR